MDRATAARLCGHDVLAQLGGSELGLSLAEAAKRRLQYGPNVLKKERITALRILGRQFQSALIYFLMVAAVLAFFTGDMSDSIIITIILLLNTALGFSQEYRSERAVERLSRLISDKVLVKRDGRAMLVEVVDLVPGDIVVLKEGDVVPADIKLLTADNVAVDESQLTGESVPVSKTAEVDTASDGDASLIFAGSTVVRGELTGVVYATANETTLGRIAVLSTSIRKVTQYEKSLRAFSALLLKITIVTLTATLLLKISLNGIAHFPQLLLFVIALAVAVVPEALPVIATLTLARGALRMASEKVVVKRLSSLEDLGNITILCTDKTGTLTENRLTIQHVDASDQHLFEILAYATIDQAALGTRGTQSSFDAAFDMYISPDIKQQARTFTILKEIPFDPAARRRRVLLADQTTGSHYLVVIGAPETLLDLTHPASEQHYRAKIAVEGQQGLRHLALAYKQLTATDTTDILELEKDCIFLGFVTLTDPLRASTPQTIATAKQLGVAIKILSGDSCEVVAYVARQVGLLSAEGCIYTGDELAKMSSSAFRHAVLECNAFARVSPEQKFSIIQVLKEQEIVGYQGDGINDAPALRLADVAIAVDSATDVAKASADIILLDKDLGVIINAIRYGRMIFANINKYIKYTMVGNFGNFFALSLLYLLATTLPLLPRQVLLISLLTDLPLIAISTDAVSSDDLQQPSRYSASALLSISLVLGSVTALAELVFFATVLGQTTSTRSTSLYLFLTFTQLIVILSVRNQGHFWKAAAPSRLLLGAITLTGVIAVAIPYLRPTARLFTFNAPTPQEVGIILLITVLYVLVLDMVKVWYYKKADSSGKLRLQWLSRRRRMSLLP